jgi:HEAT repeat protein
MVGRSAQPAILLALGILGAIPTLRADEQDDRVAKQLVSVVQDPRASLFARIEAAKTIAKMGPRAAEAVDGLTSFLPTMKGEDLSDLHETVLRALGEIGPPARKSIPIMVRSSGRSIDLDRAVTQSVNRILTGPERLDVALLISRLNDRDPAVRLASVKSLTILGGNASAAITALSNSLNDPDADVRRASVVALRTISPQTRPTDAVFRVFILDLQDSEAGVRLRAIKNLADFGTKANIALGPLQELLNDPDRDVRRAAFEALGKINPP